MARPGPGPRNPKDIRDLVTMLFGTGARKGELLGLRWCDLTLVGDDTGANITATVTYTPDDGIRRTDPKTRGSTRVVYLIPAVVEMLRELGGPVRRRPRGAQVTPVFGTPGKPEKFRDPAWSRPGHPRRSSTGTA